MDLYNNAVGRRLAADPANAGLPDEEVIMKALRDGKLRIAPFQAPEEKLDFLSNIYGYFGS